MCFAFSGADIPLLLPRALLFVEGGWESQCTGGLEGGHPARQRMQGCPLLHCFSAGVKAQRTFGPCGTLKVYVWGSRARLLCYGI